MATKVPCIGTSWKMNKVRAEARAFAEALRASPVATCERVQPFVIPPFPYIAEVADLLAGTRVKVGAQNMHWDDKGAWTGEVSPLMVKDCGASLVEIGHSRAPQPFRRDRRDGRQEDRRRPAARPRCPRLRRRYPRRIRRRQHRCRARTTNPGAAVAGRPRCSGKCLDRLRAGVVDRRWWRSR